MSVTCEQLIVPALRKAGISKLPGTGPSADQYTELIPELNRMMSSFSLNGAYVFTTAIDDFVWPDDTASRTFGPSGDYTMAKAPLYISAADWIMEGSNPEIQYPLTIVRTAQEWLQLAIPGLPTTYPALLYPNNNQPNLEIKLFPKPTQGSILRLATWTRLKSDFTSKTDVAYLPDGYEDAIVNNFALRIETLNPGPFQGARVTQEVRKQAADSLRRVRALNTVSPPCISDADFINTSNYTDGLSARLRFLSGGIVG